MSIDTQWFPLWRTTFNNTGEALIEVLPVQWAAQVVTGDQLSSVSRWMPGLVALSSDALLVGLSMPGWVESERIDRSDILEVDPVDADAVRMISRLDSTDSHVAYFRIDPRFPSTGPLNARDAFLEHLRPGPTSVCFACGQGLMPEQQFCGNCGNAQPLVCPHCHAESLATDRFCANCGRPRST